MTDYIYPESISEALEILHQASGTARILGGGTDLIPDLRSEKIQAQILVDITRIPGLKDISFQKNFIEVGAAVTFGDLNQHTLIKRVTPVLADAAGAVGAGGIQQSATWVGNLVQAMPAADGAIAALALEAQVRIHDVRQTRWVDVEGLFQGPGFSSIDPTRELISAVRIPVPTDRWGNAWGRVGRRSALTLPIINCAVKIILSSSKESEQIEKAVIAIGPASTCPFRARKAESALQGAQPDPGRFREIGLISQSEAQPRSNPLRASQTYRQEIIPALVANNLSRAYLHAKKPPLEDE